MKFNGIIYCRTNIVNGKKYIGQTTNEYLRQHKWNNLKLPYSGSLINNARKKYGLSAFTYTILVECEADTNEQLKELLNFWEKSYIGYFNTKTPNGYNLTDGGDGFLGYKQTKEHREKISSANKGKKRSDETRKKLSERRKGKPITNTEFEKKLKHNLVHHLYQYNKYGELVKYWRCAADTKEFGYSPSQIRKCCTESGKRKHKGFVWSYSEMTKDQVQYKYTTYKCSQEKKDKIAMANGKLVYQYSIDGELLKFWKSTQEAERNGFSSSKISLCCNGKRKTHKGFIWSYNKLEKN